MVNLLINHHTITIHERYKQPSRNGRFISGFPTLLLNLNINRIIPSIIYKVGNINITILVHQWKSMVNIWWADRELGDFTNGTGNFTTYYLQQSISSTKAIKNLQQSVICCLQKIWEWLYRSNWAFAPMGSRDAGKLFSFLVGWILMMLILGWYSGL